MPLQLTANTEYAISYYAVLSAAASPQTLKVSIGNAQNPAAQTNVLQTQTITGTTYTQYTTLYTPTTSGVYYVGLRNNTGIVTTVSNLRIDTFKVIVNPLSTDNFLNSTFSLSPNPANKIITISNLENSNISEVTIVDLNGRVVKTKKFENVINIEMNIEDLTSGMYLLNITTSAGIITKKIIKE
ncbi:MAG: T9SS type A sorting domain-containing protein [Flavobacterium sp.]|nr:T9SS type A sorting domain-containing protein [Flavobacterium sp.]